MMILRAGGGVSHFFPYYDLGGCGKFPTKITSSKGGANHFLDLLVSKYKRLKIV